MPINNIDNGNNLDLPKNTPENKGGAVNNFLKSTKTKLLTVGTALIIPAACTSNINAPQQPAPTPTASTSSSTEATEKTKTDPTTESAKEIETDPIWKKADDAVKTVIAKIEPEKSTDTSTEGVRLRKNSSLSEISMIDLGTKAIVIVPQKVTTDKINKMDINTDAKVSEKSSEVRKELRGLVLENKTGVVPITDSNEKELASVYVVANTTYETKDGPKTHSFYSNLSAWPAKTALYDLVKGGQKIGTLGIHTITNIHTGEKSFTIEYATGQDLRINIGSAPISLPATKENTTNKIVLKSVAAKNPELSFDDESISLERDKKDIGKKETLYDITLTTALKTIEQITKEMEAKAKK